MFDFWDIVLKVLLGICVLLLVGLLVLLGYWGFISIRNANLAYEETPATATVSRLEHKEAYTTTTFIYVNKMMIPQTHHHPEEYNVYLVHNSNEYCLDNEKWFNYLKVGDSVDVIVHEGYNKKGEILNIYLTFAE